jgi:hypothetical protein
VAAASWPSLSGVITTFHPARDWRSHLALGHTLPHQCRRSPLEDPS